VKTTIGRPLGDFHPKQVLGFGVVTARQRLQVGMRAGFLMFFVFAAKLVT
jgi:hypothetical protein